VGVKNLLVGWQFWAVGGEATSMDFPSTVHGAYLSGEREARNIIAAASA
jgi:hypothetical protein